MSELTINGLRYHYVEAGSGEPLLLLHGFTGSSANWRGLMDGLRDRYHLIAVDLPGHGRTELANDLTRYEMTAVAEDIATLLYQLGITATHLLGYSMGGRLALYFTAHYPELVRSLIVESGSPGLSSAIEREGRIAQDEALARRIEEEGIPVFVDYWERLPLFASQRALPAAARDALREQRLGNSAAGLANSLRGMGTGVQPSLWMRLPDIAVPALLVAGELDVKFAVIIREMAAQMPNAWLAIIAGTGHAVHLERPEWFARTVETFLVRLSQRGGEHLADAEQDDEGQRGQ